MIAKLVPWLLTAATFATDEPPGGQTLLPQAFSPLPVGSIKPTGWLLTYMQNMAAGLAGNMYSDEKARDGTLFYNYVRQSPWLNRNWTGATYSDLNEALPYWFNGLVPLAYSLDDEKLKAQVHEVAETVLDLQSERGWIGPEKVEQWNWWARYPFFLGLTQLVEADLTWGDKVIPKLRKFMDLIAELLLDNQGEKYLSCYPDHMNSDCSWSSIRLADFMITMQWMLENYPSDDGDATLWSNMNMSHVGAQWNWENLFGVGLNEKALGLIFGADDYTFPYVHGVNIGHLLKAPAVIRRFTYNDSLVNASLSATNRIFRDHGTPSGSIFGDALLYDNKPYTGSELSIAVEAGYSLACLYQAFGDNHYADRAEMVYFNAVPTSISPDYWSRRHIDQPNQPFARIDSIGSNIFSTANDGRVTIFSLESVSPSSTVNFPQGVSKFLTHSWAKVGSTGLIHALLGPSKVNTKIAGKDVTVECSTNYPFNNVLRYNVTTETDFSLHLRIPGWNIQEQSGVYFNGDRNRTDFSGGGRIHNISILAGTTGITYILGMRPYFLFRTPCSGSVYMGNVLYSLDFNMECTSHPPQEYNHPTGSNNTVQVPPDFSSASDREYFGSLPWNIAIDYSSLRYGSSNPGGIDDIDRFQLNSSTTFVYVEGCEVEWGLYRHVTPDVPPKKPGCLTPMESYRLIPYGAAKIHMAELPILGEYLPD
ncbi:hypothetical protein F5Y05DRAFT_419845, partial [Hypoxylon sp. FL0543]